MKPLSLDAEWIFIHNDTFERAKRAVRERSGDTLVDILEWAKAQYEEDKEFMKWWEKQA